MFIGIGFVEIYGRKKEPGFRKTDRYPGTRDVISRAALPQKAYVSNQTDNWNHLYLSIFPVGNSVVLLYIAPNFPFEP